MRNAIVIGDDNHAQGGPHGQGEVFVALKLTVLSQYKLVFKACNTKKQFPNSIHLVTLYTGTLSRKIYSWHSIELAHLDGKYVQSTMLGPSTIFQLRKWFTKPTLRPDAFIFT